LKIIDYNKKNSKKLWNNYQDQVEWLQLWPCLVLPWCEASSTIWDCCWPWGVQVLLGPVA